MRTLSAISQTLNDKNVGSVGVQSARSRRRTLSANGLTRPPRRPLLPRTGGAGTRSEDEVATESGRGTAVLCLRVVVLVGSAVRLGGLRMEGPRGKGTQQIDR